MKPALKKNVKARLYKHLDAYVALCLHADYANQPVYVLPATAEAFDAIVEQMQRAMSKGHYGSVNAMSTVMEDNAVLALAAIGITEPALAPKKNGREKA